MILPRYPVYVPSKGRADVCMTSGFLSRDGVPHFVVVEPQEADAYRATVGRDPLCTVLELPFRDLGQGSIPARNWIKDHAVAAGADRHWQLDDVLVARPATATTCTGCAGGSASASRARPAPPSARSRTSWTYDGFCVPSARRRPPFYLNVHVYSCTLVDNRLPFRWRGRYNEDTDLQKVAPTIESEVVREIVAEATTLVKGGQRAKRG